VYARLIINKLNLKKKKHNIVFSFYESSWNMTSKSLSPFAMTRNGEIFPTGIVTNHKRMSSTVAFERCFPSSGSIRRRTIKYQSAGLVGVRGVTCDKRCKTLDPSGGGKGTKRKRWTKPEIIFSGFSGKTRGTVPG